jgi:hypothetical protein
MYQVSLDDQLSPIVEKLNDMYQFGACETHPDIRCFHYRPNDWHFDLDSNRIKVWANAIVHLRLQYILQRSLIVL